MKGLIMEYPLTLTHFFERTRRLFSKKTLGTRVPGVGLVKYTYADFCDRTARLAGALAALGIRKGDRVGTLAWNSHRHLEVYFAAPLMGAVLHTVNLRLSAQDIAYIVNHAEDQVLITDASLWPIGGPNPQPHDIVEIIHNERVTFVGAVPTVWIAIQAILEKEPHWDISCVSRIPIGGSAAPQALIEAFEKQYGASMVHAWGMTEMTPLGTICRLKSSMETLPDPARYAIRAKQGYNTVCVDIRIVDEAGVEQPWDGKSVGEIQVRGPWVTSGYYNLPEGSAQFTGDGWFRTGDVASIDPEGYVQITDRTKDLIKSGGEWISSVDLETTIMGHPKVLEAAVIAVPHPKWVERPLACVVPKPGMTLE